MKKTLVLSVLLSLVMLTSAALASPVSWLSTRYRSNPNSTGSTHRSPVEEGHLDVYLLVENVTFTDVEFSVRYDSAIVHQPGILNVMDLHPALQVAAVNTEDLDGTWKETTFILSGNLSLGDIQYLSEAILRIRFFPHAEGTVPIGLWPGWTLFPEHYRTCSLVLMNDGEPVEHGPKEWNDGITLFAFTDKTDARVMYHYDLNFGTPVEGFFRVTYADESVEEFHSSDHARGITIDPAFGAYFLTAQPNAVSCAMIFPGYEDWDPLDLSSGYTWSLTHSQPANHVDIPEKYEGFYGVKATSDDLVLTAKQPGIGLDFETSHYSAALSGWASGILSKTFDFEYVDDDTIRFTIQGGLEPDEYNIYFYKDGVLLGRNWFSASLYYPVTFTVQDEEGNPLHNVAVSFEMWGMELTILEERTDENGRAFFEMPGHPEWGNMYEYRVIAAGYEIASDWVEVYASPVDVLVTLTPAPGVNLNDFAAFASWWQYQECNSWDNDRCEGADMNLDGAVDIEDLALFAARWLRDM